MSAWLSAFVKSSVTSSIVASFNESYLREEAIVLASADRTEAASRLR